MKKMIIPVAFIIALLFASSAVAVTDYELKLALKRALLDYYENPTDSVLSVDELMDLLDKYLLTEEGMGIVDLSSTGLNSGETINYIYNKALYILRNLPSCSDGSIYGECSQVNRGKLCFSGTLVADAGCEAGGCTSTWAPVCGVNGGTFSNECWLNNAGIAKSHDGPCAQCQQDADCPIVACITEPCPYYTCQNKICLFVSSTYPDVCGGDLGLTCTSGYHCEYSGGSTTSTYPSELGKCVKDGTTYTGGVGGLSSVDSESVDGETSETSTTSTCVPIWDPVCGVDGNTYSNGCEANKAGVKVASSGECPITATANLDTEFQLGFNQTVSIESENLAIKFVAVTEDSRCPTGVMCIRAGQVTVVVNILKDGADLGDFSLTVGDFITGGSPVKNFDGYSIELVKVDPYPGGEAPKKGSVAEEVESIEIALSDYIITLIVSVSTEDEIVCPAYVDYVCGVDGVTYTNICEAEKAGVDVDYNCECEYGPDCSGREGGVIIIDDGV